MPDMYFSTPVAKLSAAFVILCAALLLIIAKPAEAAGTAEYLISPAKADAPALSVLYATVMTQTGAFAKRLANV